MDRDIGHLMFCPSKNMCILAYRMQMVSRMPLDEITQYLRVVRESGYRAFLKIFSDYMHMHEYLVAQILVATVGGIRPELVERVAALTSLSVDDIQPIFDKCITRQKDYLGFIDEIFTIYKQRCVDP